MATITGLTAARMTQIEAQSVVDGDVVAGNLILTKHDGTTINAGSVVGPTGPQGPQGVTPIPGIPGEMKLWPGATLPNQAQYGHWVWANGDIFNVSQYPLAAANIAPAWKTAGGLADPGAGKFRVPDMRGLVPAGPDAMPIGAARVNRLTRAQALPIASIMGEEKHLMITNEMPSHAHVFRGTQMDPHGHGGSTFAGTPVTTGPESGHIHTSFNRSPGVTYAKNNTATAGGFVVTDINNTTLSQAADHFDPNTGPSSGHTHSVTAAGTVTVASVTAGTPAGTNDPTPAAGTTVSHENMQPTVMVPYIVKLDD